MNDAITLEKNKVSVKEVGYLFIKRLFDIICGLLGCILILPIAIVVKIAYVCNKDFASIFYSQIRIGKNGKKFKLYKFRSMVPNADEILSKTLEMDKVAAEQWRKYQKLENDPRITKMGNILRKTSLDEIPQVFNVLKGDMSMIGPRPLVIGELDAHKGNHEIYESVRPGITGWWACNGRSATTYKKRKELGIKEDTIVIGHIGRFVAQKNHTFLIDIFNQFHKKEKNSILLLAGQGPLQEEIKNKVRELGLDDSVRFLGQRNDANELYQVFDVFLLPSLYEGLPVVGVEAQASGLLCFLSDDMTKETKVLDSTVFMSLSNTAEEWTDEILTNLKDYKRINTKSEVSDNGFDIEVEARKLEKYYIN